MNLRDALPAAMIAAACGVAAIVLAGRARPTAPVHEPVPVAAPLLDGLRAGDRIAGWSVAAIDPTSDDGLDVAMTRDGVVFVLTVVPLGVRPENPPFADETHAIYYGHARPAGTQIPAGALRAITADLLRRLARANR